MQQANDENMSQIQDTFGSIIQGHNQQEQVGFSVQQIRQAQQLSLRTQPNYQNHYNRLPKRYHKYIKKMKIGTTSQSCTICLNKYETNQVIDKLPCGHIVHHKCCKQWFVVEHKCPVCRMDLKLYFEGLYDMEMLRNQQQIKGTFNKE